MEYRLEVVVIQVADVDRAKSFYVDTLGWQCDFDHGDGDVFRVVQTTPPGSSCSVTFGIGLGGPSAGSPGLQLVADDITAAHADLAGRGVDCSPVQHIVEGEWIDGHGGPWNAFVHFTDPDGTAWAVQERPSA